MSTLIKSIVCVLLLSVLSSGSVAAEAAPQSVNGTFKVTVNSASIEPIGDICRVSLNATFTFSGSLVGAFTSPFSIVHFGPCAAAAREVFATRGLYTGSVLGNSGSFNYAFAGAIDAAGHAQGDLFILHGSAGLADLQGMLKLSGQSGIGGTYTGTVTVDS
jgi:hypothetical protein